MSGNPSLSESSPLSEGNFGYSIRKNSANDQLCCDILESFKSTFINISKELNNSYSILIEKKFNDLNTLYIKLLSPENILNIKKIQFQNIKKNVEFQINQKINFNHSLFNNLKRLLISNSVDNNLKKGFVILQKSKKIIRQSNQIKKIDKIKIKFFDKKIAVKIEKI